MASIIPARSSASDRFPVISFRVKTGGNHWFSIALATNPGLFPSPQKSQRTNSNFYASEVLPAQDGEAIYIVPEAILKRFAGNTKLYYGLVTFSDAGGNSPGEVLTPTEESPFVNIESFTGRELRRKTTLPVMRSGHAANGNGYNGTNNELEWGGDVVTPGSEAVAEPGIASTPEPTPGAQLPNGTASPRIPQQNGGAPISTVEAPATSPQPSEAAALAYDDGFGLMPEISPSAHQAHHNGQTELAERSMGAGAIVPIVSSIVGATMTRVTNNAGDVNWELDQLQGLRYPDRDPANEGNGQYRNASFVSSGLWLENGFTDRITADFEIRWDYNGRSLGNVQILNTGANDAVGWGLTVKGVIMPNEELYTAPGSPETFAGIYVTFTYRFTRTIGSDNIGQINITLYGNGTHDMQYRWTQTAAMSGEYLL